MNLRHARYLFAAAVLLSVASRSDAAFQVGDLIAAERDALPIGDIAGQMELFRNGARDALLQFYFGDVPTGAAVDHDFNVYLTRDNSIQVFTAGGQPGGDFGGSLLGQYPDSISFAANGNAYVGLSVGPTKILQLSPTGTVLRTYDSGSFGGANPWSVDLASDQCTLYFSIRLSKVIGRYDVCTGTRLADFTSSLPGTDPGAIRLLSDGGLLVADGPAIYRLSPTGIVTQTFTDPIAVRWAALALDPSGTTFWAASGDLIYQFSLVGGPPIRGPLQTSYSVSSLAVVGEPRVAVPAAIAAVSTPFLSPMTLVFLGLLLAITAAVRLR